VWGESLKITDHTDAVCMCVYATPRRSLTSGGKRTAEKRRGIIIYKEKNKEIPRPIKYMPTFFKIHVLILSLASDRLFFSVSRQFWIYFNYYSKQMSPRRTDSSTA